LAGEIVPALEASLGDQRPWVRQLAAFQILCLDPDHAKASALLLRAMKEADPISLRAQAANFYWQLTGDTELTLPVLRQALETVKDAQTQHPLHHVAELGAAAKPVSPQIQSLLTNEDRIIRNLAGKALRRIAPELLPPINESSP
jgi:HEAT repeat protein